MKQDFLDNLDGGWGNVISNTYKDNNMFIPECKIINNRKVIPEHMYNSCETDKPIRFDSDIYSIDEFAFFAFTGKGELILPPNLKIIGDGAFSNIDGIIGNLVFPDSVEQIGVEAFGNTFDNCEGLNGYLKLPNNINFKIINRYTFLGCENLSGELIIPDSVEKIDKEAFCRASNFSTLILSKNIKYIGENAFSDCYGLSGKLVLPEGLEYIDIEAFKNTSFDRILYIPESVKYIGYRAFANVYFDEIHISKKYVDKWHEDWNDRSCDNIIYY